MTRSVTVDASPSQYIQNISVGPHRIQSDEPSEAGGKDAGPNPYELLLSALGACTSMTVGMYAERKQWPLDGIHVNLTFSRIHAADCTDCDGKKDLVNKINLEITLLGDLSDIQRQRLLEVANNCPVHRTLVSEIQIRSTLSSAGQVIIAAGGKRM